MNSHVCNSRRYRILPAIVLLHAAAVIAPLAAHAQSSGSISGMVLDATTHAPLKGATALLRNPADSTERALGAVSGANGAFTIEHVAQGRAYRLEISYVGYEKYVKENVAVESGKSVLGLGDVLMTAAAIDVKGVDVKSQRDQVQVLADKTVYSVADNPAYTAANVSDLLAQIPSVSVDQDGKVSLRGNDNVTIMVNGRPLTMPADQRNKYLQSLPASVVSDIEIRTNPGAQFDAKYEGGIINIVTRRPNSDTFGGNINAGVDTRPLWSGSTGLFYNGPDLTASLGGSLYRSSNPGFNSSLRLNYHDTNEYRDVGEDTNTQKSSSWNVYGQVDYKFTQSDLASLSFNLSNWKSIYNSSIGTHTFYNTNNAVVGYYNDGAIPAPDGQSGGTYNSASLLLKHTFAKDHTLGLDFSYNDNSYDWDQGYFSRFFRPNGELDSARSSDRNGYYHQVSRTLITTLDYENPLSDQITLSAGGKNEINMLDYNTSVLSLDRRIGEFVVDSMQTNHYLPRNSIYAVYGTVAYKPIEALSVQAGLRYEQATVSAKFESGSTIISRNYSNIFPSGSIAYTLGEAHSLTFSYRRSIALPSIDALNPVRVKWTDWVERAGNPDLEPEFTQTLELNYSTFWGAGDMFSLAPYYSTSSGSIQSTEEMVNGISRTGFANFNGAYTIGSEFSIATHPLQWLNLRVSGNAFNTVNRGGPIAGDLHSSASGYSGNLTLSADIMKGLTFATNISLNRPAQVGASQQSGYTFWVFSLRQRLLDNKLTVMLRVNDPFKLQKWSVAYTSPDFHTESTSTWTSQFVGLNLSYTFGTTPRMEQHIQDKSDTKGSGGGAGGSGGGAGG